MSRNGLLKALGSSVFLGLCGTLASAQVTVYDNFGAGYGGFDYNWGLGWTVAGENLTSSQYGVEQAMSFTPTTSGVLSDVWVAMWYVPLDSGYDEVTLKLTTNPSGLPPEPADVMEEWTITSFQSWSAWSPPHHLLGDGGSYLLAGQSYWLWAVAGDTTWTGWCMNEDPAFTCPHAMRREGENWLPVSNETASAFRVDVLTQPGIGYCFGDPNSGTPCPCSNDNDGSVPGSGCANGVFSSGAQLSGSGTPSVSADTLVLQTTGLEPNNTGLYFQAQNRVNSGSGNPFGDGLRCAGGGLIRLQIRTSDGAGLSSTTIALAAKGGVVAGDTKRYQCWYRTTQNPPCGLGVNDFNLSNGFEVTWIP